MFQSKDREESTSIGVFPIMLRIIAVISVIGGFIAGNELAYDYSSFFRSFDQVIAWKWRMAGIASACAWWALSIIVAACQKYLRKD